jgi:DNA gyrase subunit A
MLVAMAPRRAAKPDHESPALRVIERPADDELSDSFLRYSLSVITARAIPDVRDGLKPVQRRLLWSMYRSRRLPDRPHVKSAKVIGDCMGTYHPHGDQALYEALVRMGQPHQCNLVLVDPHGNFGNADSPPAQYRYTECRLSPHAMELLGDTDRGAVPMRPNFDGSEQEPEVLAARFPNLLINGTMGIAVGFNSLVLPHNPGEVLKAARALLAQPNMTSARFRRLLPGPDLPSGGLLSTSGLDDLHDTGRATLTQSARVVKHPRSKLGWTLVFDRLPYQIGAERVIEQIQDGVRKGPLAELVRATRDTSDTDGPALEVELKPNIDPDDATERLMARTSLRLQLRSQQVVLVDGQPTMLTPRQMIEYWLRWRTQAEIAAVQHLLGQLLQRLARAEVMVAVANQPRKVVDIILAASSADQAKGKIRQLLSCTEEQAGWVLDLPLRQLAKLERDRTQAEHDQLAARVQELRELLADDTKMAKRIDQDMVRLLKQMDRPRLTELVNG